MSRRTASQKAPLSGKPENQLDRLEVFKKMCRMLEVKRRRFLENDWRNFEQKLTQQQFLHLTMVRFSLPCNLARIMELTGLTSAGASIFVDKLVNCGIFVRIDDPDDRRNVIINFTEHGSELAAKLEDRLNAYILHYFSGCTEEELRLVEEASRFVCRKLDGGGC